MSRSTLLALGAGAVSTFLWLTVVLGPITSLPLFLAGLSLGTQAATIACATGFFLAWVLALQDGGGATVAGLYGLIHAIPALIVTRQALLHRSGRTDPEAWYSAGGVVSVLTAFAMALLLLAAVAMWMQGLSVVATLTDQVTQLVDIMASTRTAEERQEFVELVVPVLPGLFMASWMLVTLVNGGLAQSLLTRMGRNLRPKGSLGTIDLPMWMSWLLVISAAVALAGPGDLGYIGRNLALVAAMPFFLVGVSLAHLVARRTSWPGPALAGFYLALLLLGPALLLVAGFGIIDQWFGLRQRLGAPGNDQETE
jgi:hypothetical protein